MDKVLQSYAYAILAKDAGSRWSNPRRALRSYEDIMDMANQADSKGSFQEFIGQAIKDGLAQALLTPDAGVQVEQPSGKGATVHTAPPTPRADHSKLDKKEFYREQRDFQNKMNARFDSIIATVDNLVKALPPPAKKAGRPKKSAK
jgi:hypothetical protein